MIETVQSIFSRSSTKKAAIPLLEVIIGRLGSQTAQMRRHTAHIWVNGHSVIVEKDNQRLAGGPGIVQALIGQSASQRTISNQS